MQGCRRCQDRGAELLVAGSGALDGYFAEGLRERHSFRLQARAALHALAAETPLPLVTASYAALPGEELAQPRPYLLCSGQVQMCPESGVYSVAGRSIYVDVAPCLSAPLAGVDAILHLPGDTWRPGGTRETEKIAEQEARLCHSRVVIAQGVACAEGRLAAGGSLAADAAGVSARCPLFREAAVVSAPGRQALADELSAADELTEAVCFCLREMAHARGDVELAAVVEGPHGRLLLALARLAVGARRTRALSRDGERSALAGKYTRLAAVPQVDSPALAERMRAEALSHCADERGLLLLHGMDMATRLCGEILPPPVSRGGAFAPLGDMLSGEIDMLRKSVARRLPPHLRAELAPEPQTSDEELLRLLMLEQRSPAEIAVIRGGDETAARCLLRKIRQAAPLQPYYPPALRMAHRAHALPPHHSFCE